MMHCKQVALATPLLHTPPSLACLNSNLAACLQDHCEGIEAHGRHIYCTSLTRDLVLNKFPSLGSGVRWTTLTLGETVHLEADGIRCGAVQDAMQRLLCQ